MTTTIRTEMVANIDAGIRAQSGPASPRIGWQFRERLSSGLRFLAARAGIRVKRTAKMLTIRESVPFGNRCFLSIVEVGTQRFLVGSTPASVALLSPLPDRCATPQELGAKHELKASGLESRGGDS